MVKGVRCAGYSYQTVFDDDLNEAIRVCKSHWGTCNCMIKDDYDNYELFKEKGEVAASNTAWVSQ